jgi:hypothetical protein
VYVGISNFSAGADRRFVIIYCKRALAKYSLEVLAFSTEPVITVPSARALKRHVTFVRGELVAENFLEPS